MIELAAQTISATAENVHAEIIHEAKGKHLLLTLRDCRSNILNDIEQLSQLANAAAIATGATVLQIVCHQFAPQGVTALVVLAESHASLHTYPESNVVFWDCFTCGSTCDPQRGVAVLKEALQAGSVDEQLIIRE